MMLNKSNNCSSNKASPNTSFPTWTWSSSVILLILTLLSNPSNLLGVNGQDIQTNLTLARTTFKNTFDGTTGDVMYGFLYERICFCFPKSVLGPNWVVVEKNTIRNISNRFSEPIKEDISNTILTIDGLFDLIQDAIDTNAVSIDVTFNEMYGYPSSIAIDYDDMIADEEYYIDIDAFSPYSVWIDDYTTNKQTWENNLIAMTTASDGSSSSTSMIPYEFTYQRICFCQEEYLGPFNVKVDENGVITEVTNICYHDKNNVVDTTGNTMWNVPTINEVFVTIGNALPTSVDGRLPAFQLDIVYDKAYGYPKDVYIDYEERMADEEYGAMISNVNLIFPTSTTMEGATSSNGSGDTPTMAQSASEPIDDRNDPDSVLSSSPSYKSFVFVSNITLLVAVSLLVLLIDN